MSGDPIELALTTDRDAFVARFRHPFLYAATPPRRRRTPLRRTIEARPVRRPTFDDITDVSLRLPEARAFDEEPGAPLVVAVAKVQREFPGMITVGRTESNDVVIDDAQVSKFHAFFRALDGGWELSDAGSRNGTFIDGEKLVPKASWTSSSVTPGKRLASGAVVRFGDIELLFVDAGGLWDRVRGIAPR